MKKEIEKILTEYNFDRLSFDDATEQLLNLLSVSSSLPILNKKTMIDWLTGLRDSVYSARDIEGSEQTKDFYDSLIHDIETLWQ